MRHWLFGVGILAGAMVAGCREPAAPPVCPQISCPPPATGGAGDVDEDERSGRRAAADTGRATQPGRQDAPLPIGERTVPERRPNAEGTAPRAAAPAPGANDRVAGGTDEPWYQDAARAAAEAVGKKPEEVVIATATLEGPVREASEKTVSVEDESGELVELQVTEQSVVTRGRRKVPAAQLREGSDVRASYDITNDGRAVLRTLEVRPRRR